jgi:hypothetical protein
MDHILRPLEPTNNTDEVPYLVTKDHEYDGGEFESLHTRKGFKLSRLDGSSHLRLITVRSDEEQFIETTFSLFQSWLFFGILQDTSEGLQMTIDTNRFINTNHNGQKSSTLNSSRM